GVDSLLCGCNTIIEVFAFFFFFFFFQAEDGIRDKLVTGVQTCALPIFGAGNRRGRTVSRGLPWLPHDSGPRSSRSDSCRGSNSRSEERRVGKECRSGWWADR